MLKFIENSDNYYICDEGYVIRNKKKLKPRPTRYGYLRVNIKINGVFVDKYIHRLVAEYFIPNPQNFPEVNHKDGCKNNNHVSNLEWCTKKKNMEHASAIGLLSKKRSPKGINKKKIKNASKPRKSAKMMAKYDFNGKYIGEEQSNNFGASTYLFRLCVNHQFFYRDKELLIKVYGKVPEQINVDRIKPFLNNQKRIFIGTKENGEQIIVYQMSDLPITKSMFHYAYNHDIPDQWGYKWEMKIRHHRISKI